MTPNFFTTFSLSLASLPFHSLVEHQYHHQLRRVTVLPTYKTHQYVTTPRTANSWTLDLVSEPRSVPYQPHKLHKYISTSFYCGHKHKRPSTRIINPFTKSHLPTMTKSSTPRVTYADPDEQRGRSGYDEFHAPAMSAKVQSQPRREPNKNSQKMINMNYLGRTVPIPLRAPWPHPPRAPPPPPPASPRLDSSSRRRPSTSTQPAAATRTSSSSEARP